MTENEAKQWLKHTRAYQHKCDNCEYIDIKGSCNEECKDFYDMAIQALEEIQQYREIGTVEELEVLNRIAEETAEYVKEDKKILETYQRIGTIEEFKALKDKHIGKDNMVISSSDLMTILNSDSEELKQYKEVGTVEEFKALKVKNTPMELDEHNFQDEPHHYLCPCCRNIVSCNQNYCEECGQALET